MKILFLLAHAIPAAKARYEEACWRDVRVVPFIAPPIPGVPGGGLSARYSAFAQKLRRWGNTPFLPALLAWLGLADEEHDAVVFGWYSAGYALARELAATDEDRSAIAGWVGVDGGHAPEEADGSPDDRSIAWLVKLCREADAGRSVLAYGHTDVDPIRYASTGSTIREALRLAPVELQTLRLGCQGCAAGVSLMGMREPPSLIRVESHNHHTNPTREHGAALLDWGPMLAARAVTMVMAAHGLRDRGGLGDDVHAGPDAGGAGANGGDVGGGAAGVGRGHGSVPACELGAFALAAAVAELERGAREEPPGTNGGPDIERYLSGCVRGGRPIGIKTGAWCAAFAGWCDHEAQRAMRAANPGSAPTPPVEWRAAVWELVEDARRSGAWREVGEYSPLAGDLAIYKRSGQDPRHQGHLGHVGRVEVPPPDAAGRYTTIDGNSGPGGYRVARVEHHLPEAALVGWICYKA